MINQQQLVMQKLGK